MENSFNHIGKYVCICGREFNNSQSFNGHKSHCKEHQIQKHGSLEVSLKRNREAGKSISKFYANTREENLKKKEKEKQDLLDLWLSEQHTCEKCGKIMTGYYGSGRFCSRSCANSREYSEKVRQNISNGMKNSPNITHSTRDYIKSPNLCVVCDSTLPYSNSSGYCSKCTWKNKENRENLSKALKNSDKVGGLRKGSGIGHKGWYKGFYCDSTYELAYVIYNLDHNIPFKRCHRTYEYEYNGEKHKYHPDFELEDGSLVEIKGYVNSQTKAKLESVKDRPLKVLFKKDLKYAFDYVKNNYVYEKLEDLYDD